MQSAAISRYAFPAIRLWRRVLLVAAASLLVCFYSGAAAQGQPVSLDQWTVEVWPEYDRPAVLVLLNGTLAPDVSLPASLRIPVPPDAQVHAVAYRNEEGTLISTPWETAPNGTGSDVTFSLEQPGFVVEYYIDGISPPPDRSFDLALSAPYPAAQASLALRQPARASNLQTEPPMQPAGVDAGGNPLYGLELGALTAGQTIPLRVSYTKADENPTIASALVDDAPAAVADQTGAGQDWLPLGVGLALGLALAAVAGLLLWRRRQARGLSRQARRRAAREKGTAPERAASPSPASKAAQNSFCTRCGARFDAADRFCRSCGAERR